jgi:hypothetical protein
MQQTLQSKQLMMKSISEALSLFKKWIMFSFKMTQTWSQAAITIEG